MDKKPKKLFSVTLPDGKIEKRKSSHEYRFAVAVLQDSPIHKGWGVLGYRKEKIAADLLAASVDKWPNDSYKPLEVKILPVEKGVPHGKK